MPKTAIILTGQMRTFDRCLPTLHHHVLSNPRFGDLSFFVSTIADANAIKAQILKAKYPGAQVEVAAVLEQPDCVAEMRAAGADLPTSWTPGTLYTFEPYAISVSPQAVLRQLWQLREGWRLFTEKADPAAFDLVIRVRPDLFFHSFTHPGSDFLGEVATPWWGQFGGVNDRFAILGNGDPAAAYFNTYGRIPELMRGGCPLHPESLIAASIRGFVRRPLLAEFSTLRETGEMRPPEILYPDLARLIASPIR